MNQLAPVLIPTLNRYLHFKRCIESLAACHGADKTVLYIAFDYPSFESQWEGYKKNELFIDQIKGFKEINVIKRSENFGTRRNLVDARSIIFEKYDRLILSEDDNEFAALFLKFLNEGLTTYEKRQDIFAVTGYNSPFTMPSWYKHDVYLRTGFAAWGVGIWRDKWNKVDWSLESFNSMLIKKENYRKLKKYYQRYLPQLLKIRETGIITGDGFLFLYLLDKKMYSVYPVKSRVRNTGHDGSGENCGYSEEYLKQEKYEGLDDIFLPPDLQVDEKLTDYIMNQIKIPLMLKIKQRIPTSLRLTIRNVFKN
jgi:hypothetical protein